LDLQRLWPAHVGRSCGFVLVARKVDEVVKMKSRNRLAIIASLLGAFGSAMGQTTASADPIRFRGAYIGEPLSDFVGCDDTKGKSLKTDYKVHGKVCEDKPGAVYRWKTKVFLDSKEEGEAFLFENAKLFRITIHVANDDWDKVRYDLIQKDR